MSSTVLEEILAKADLLSHEEQLQVIAVLAEKASRTSASPVKPIRKWADMAGLLPYPACGEDAQTYISKIRHEANSHREDLIQRDRP
ncbi:MAG: hypothetical protein C4527_15660 [Candidatus Omnitrophota bacterium]|nr:MAG: hypothetical protein C4527_15660 [Candidatus Omnitrophota bacterium]